MQSQTHVDDDLAPRTPEPLLPIEKKLIGWSLGLGAGSLALLVLVTRLFLTGG